MTEWNAEPHTLAKIEILRKYLDAWFPIIGSTFRGQTIHYLDGFAGPGQYLGGEYGSPIVALDSASQALDNAYNAQRWVAGRIAMAFVEADPQTFRSLESRVLTHPKHSNVSAKCYSGELDSVLPRIRQDFPSAFGSAPLFAFLDPFGLKGLSWKTVEAILRSPSSEVLLLFDADGVTRAIGALSKGYNLSSETTLTSTFGGSEWRNGIVARGGKIDFRETTKEFVQIYKAKLRTLVAHTFSFQMITPKSSAYSAVGYYLIFASGHRLGLEKMKESMKTVGQGGAYTFANARTGPQQMFVFSDPSTAARAVYLHFPGRAHVRLSEIEAFVLNETEYIGPAQPLKHLEQRDLLQVHSRDSSRRRGTYPPAKVVSISFSTKENPW